MTTGVNFFDNAEVYAGGKSEEVMGAALKKLNWRTRQLFGFDQILLGLARGH
jgi:aryl-alcohol dehydrogenase-like predicted oxidoreductase